MNKIKFLTLFILLFIFNCNNVYADDVHMNIIFDGNKIEIENYLDTVNNRTYVNIEKMCDFMNSCHYDNSNKLITTNMWNDEEKKVDSIVYYTEFVDNNVINTLSFENKKELIKTNISNKKGDIISLVVKDDIHYVPIRFFMESYWYSVYWYETDPNNVYINSYDPFTKFHINDNNGIAFSNKNCNNPDYYITSSNINDNLKKNIWENVNKENISDIFTYGFCNNKLYFGKIEEKFTEFTCPANTQLKDVSEYMCSLDNCSKNDLCIEGDNGFQCCEGDM